MSYLYLCNLDNNISCKLVWKITQSYNTYDPQYAWYIVLIYNTYNVLLFKNIIYPCSSVLQSTYMYMLHHPTIHNKRILSFYNPQIVCYILPYNHNIYVLQSTTYLFNRATIHSLHVHTLLSYLWSMFVIFRFYWTLIHSHTIVQDNVLSSN